MLFLLFIQCVNPILSTFLYLNLIIFDLATGIKNIERHQLVEIHGLIASSYKMKIQFRYKKQSTGDISTKIENYS